MSFLLSQWWNQAAPIGRMERQNNYVFIGPDGKAYTSIGLKDQPSTGGILQGGPVPTPYPVSNSTGFFWLAGTNGIPTGVPFGGETGKCPITIDTVNNTFYFYNSGLWRAVGGGGGLSPLTIDSKSALYTVVTGDLGKIINCTANTFTVSLTAASTMGAGWYAWVWNSGSGVITIDPNGAETINGNSSIVLRAGEGVQIVCDGLNWIAGDQKYVSMFAGNVGTVNARPNASGTNSIAIGLRAAASSTNSTAIGANSGSQGASASSGTGALALGGSYAGGSDATAFSIANNSNFYGARSQSSIAGGINGNANAQEAIALGAYCNATGVGSTAIGSLSDAGGERSFALGLMAQANTYGKSAYASGTFNAIGGAQSGNYVLRRSGSSFPMELTTNGGAAGGGIPNQIVLQNWQAIAFSGLVVANEGIGSSNRASWKIEGMIEQGFNAASTVLVASTVTAISNVPGWTLALSADTTRGSLRINFTGGASTAYAVASIETAEVRA